MAEINETQRKKIVKVGLLETFAELVDTLYGSTMGASGQNHAPGQVPDPGATAGTSKFLCEDGTWKEPSGGSGGGNVSVMGGSGPEHAPGLVPDPGATAGTSKYLREDGTWVVPTDTQYSLVTELADGLMSKEDKAKLNSYPSKTNDTTKFLREDGTWQIPTAEPEIIKGYFLYGNFYSENRINVDYVEIGGKKWATMNIGANSITDTGLYFQWGDTQGYTASQVGSGEGQKYFNWANYKYSNSGGTIMTKYNSTDGKTVLDLEDDAAKATWGGSWRIPTKDEYVALGSAIDYIDVNGNTITASNKCITLNNVMGLYIADKNDHSKKLFFPCGGDALYSSINGLNTNGYYFSSSLYSSVDEVYSLVFRRDYNSWYISNYRYLGFNIRAIWDGEDTPTINPLVIPNINKLYLDTITNKIYRYNGSIYIKISEYSILNASNGGTDLSLVTTGDKYIWNNKEDALTIETISSGTTLTAEANKYYKFTSNVGTLAITLPTMSTTVTKPVGLMLSFTTSSSPAITIRSASSLTISYFSDYLIEANKSYELNCLWNGTKWIIAYGTIG